MGRRGKAALVILGLLQFLALVPLFALNPTPFADRTWLEGLVMGLMLGFAFAHAGVAATWAALGPLRLGVRLPGAMLWASLAAVSLVANFLAITPLPPSEHGEIILTFGGSLFALWLVVQAPLWIARSIYRFEVQFQDEGQSGIRSTDIQFGIRQLLIVTAAVGVTLALGRAILASGEREAGVIHDLGLQRFVGFGLLVLCNALVAFTVITGALLQRHWLFGVALGVCAAAVVTVVEASVLDALGGSLGLAAMMIFLAALNGVQFGWLLLNLLILRAGGYRLAASGLSTSAIAP